MVAAAVGLQVRGWRAVRLDVRRVPLARLRLRPHGGDQPRERCCLCGSHAGVSIGEDGPSQMALEDIAMIRAVHGSTVLHPVRRQPDREARRGDGRPRRDLVPAHARGRRRRCSTAPDEEFPIGGSKRLRSSDADAVTLVGCGITRARGAEGGRPARRRRDRGARDRLLLGQADRRRDARAAAARDRAASSRSRTTGPRAASATPCSRRSPSRARRAARQSSPCARCRGSGKPDELLAAAGIDADAIATRRGRCVG